MKQLYKNNIAYLFKQTQIIKGNTKVPSWETDGTAFYCNKEIKNSSLASPIASAYSLESTVILKTTAQLTFTEGDRIAFKPDARNNVDTNDFSLIQSIQALPYMQKGEKYRNKEYYEYRISIT